jgi:very-short-patch-repair endonuclease
VRRNGIPVTTPARTLLDLAAGTTSDKQLERALREAIYKHQTSLPVLSRCLSRHSGHRGAGALEKAIRRAEDAPGGFRSNPEQRFARWLRKHSLPMPAFNVPMRIADQDIEADCYWAEHGLIVEVDHRGTHAQRQAFEADRLRDRRLQAHGLCVVRVTEPYDEALYADISALLGAAGRGTQR